jgi:putative ABC transport system permease protein
MRVTPGYFQTMRMRMLSGRVFTPADGPGGQPVAIVNEALVRRHWPDGDPLGRRLSFGDEPEEEDWLTIVGVVSDITREGLDAGDRPTVYMPMAQNPNPGVWVIARTAGDPMGLAAGVKNAIWEIDPKLPVNAVHPMTERVRDAVRVPRFTAILLSLFGVVGLLLAAIGIYGVMSFDVAQRTREIGIRLALGARPDSVLAMVVGRGLRLTAIGAAAGIVGAIAASRVLASLLFGVSATDPMTFALVLAVLMAVAALATWLPARRATRVDPIEVLRAE